MMMPGAGVHLAGEPLVHERADRVDVAEQDPVHRVVEHHVEPLQAAEHGDLRHAQARRVVGQPDVPADLLRHVVERRPHDPEVLLRGVRAREPVVRGAFRHVVQQRLPGRADHRDDVGARAGGVLRLDDVLVDVTGRDDQVDPRALRRVAPLGDELVALGPVAVDRLEPLGDRGAAGLASRGQVSAGRDRELDLARGGGFRELRERRRGCARAARGTPAAPRRVRGRTARGPCRSRG